MSINLNNPKKALSTLAIPMMALMVTGCASNTSKIHDPGVIPDKKTPEYVIQKPKDQLEKLSIEIRDEVRLLAKIRQERREAEMTEHEKSVRAMQSARIPDGFEKVIDRLHVTDDLEKVISLISIQAGYGQPTILNPRARHDYPITIDIKNQTIYDALMDVGAQTDDFVQINVISHEDKKGIVVEYKERI